MTTKDTENSAWRATSVDTLKIDPCNLCPRKCAANRSEGQRGVCGAADRLIVARVALHFWEEPPISGSSGSGTVFFSHCPLGCVYCQNATIAQGKAGVELSVEQLAAKCLELQEQGAMNVNFVTPTHYTLAICEAVGRARGMGLEIPVVWNTSGYERREVIESLSGTVDVFLADYKYADAQLAGRYSHARDYPDVALRAIDAMVDVVGMPEYDEHCGESRLKGGVVVRHLLLPGSLENSLAAVEMLYDRYGDNVLYSLMNQYTPVISGALAREFPELCVSASSQDYEVLLDFADSLGMENYFWQDGPAAEESFIPAWDGTGV